MGIRNYLIEGVSGTGKTSVATELQRCGYQVVHGDRELAYRGDPVTGEPLHVATSQRYIDDVSFGHRHHLWDVGKVQSLIADRSHAVTYFCGGSRNFDRFIDLFDGVFVLSVDLPTLTRRLESRPDDEFGGKHREQEFVLKLHASQEDGPQFATIIDASEPLQSVVEDILSKCGVADQMAAKP